MILDDPALDGVGAVLFDEFHERSLDADLGLALALDASAACARTCASSSMSATLDGARVAQLLGDAPVIASEGRAFPVETRYLGRDAQRAHRGSDGGRGACGRCGAEPGSILAFLPGQGEIRARRGAAGASASAIRPSMIAPLYGAHGHGGAGPRASSRRPPGRRKVVLATSIAETSITIEGVRVVIDCGLARVPRYEPDVGVTRLETVRVSRAAADQRRGRAGRTEPGVCYRLWDEPQTQSLPAFAEPEIRTADLAGLLLDCADWGVSRSGARSPGSIRRRPPPRRRARGAGGARRARRRRPHHGASGGACARCRCRRGSPAWCSPRPNAAHAQEAAEIAAVLVERGLGGNDTDLAHRLDGFRRDRSRRAERHAPPGGAAGRGRRGARSSGAKRRGEDMSTARAAGARLSRAHRQGARRTRPVPARQRPRRQRSMRRDPLARAPFLVVAELSGSAAATRILLAAAADEADIAGDRRRSHPRERRDRLRSRRRRR